MLSAFVAVSATPYCPYGAQPFEGTGRAATESKARENANLDIASQFSTIKVNILDELTQRETSNDIKEYANYQRKIKIEGGLYTGYVKDVDGYPQKESGQFVAKRYLCPGDAAKPYLDSLKAINQRVAIQKINNSFCESLYKTYSPRVILFERILERLGETNEALVADYKKIERECDDLRVNIKKGIVSFEEALEKVVAEISSKARGKVKIAVIAEIYASPSETSDFIAAELESKLAKLKTFAMVEPVNVIFNNEKFKMSGPMKYADAIAIGKASKANVVILGSFDPYEGFSYFKIRALEVPAANVQTLKIFAMHTDKVRPDDAVLSGLLPDKRPAITEDALAYLSKGEDLYREGKYDEAIRELNRALAINGNLADGYFLRGSAYYFKNNYDRAIEDWTAALSIKPDFYEALNNRGAAYDDKGNYDRAIEDFNAVLRIDPDVHETLYNRGSAYQSKGDYDRAIEDYNSTLRIKPDYYQALNNRGNAYSDKGYYDRAIEDYNAALRIKPDYHQALNNRGNRYYDKGDYDGAIEDYNAALRIKPDYHQALFNRGAAYGKKGNLDRAIEDYTAALKIKPDYYQALTNRGLAYKDKDKPDRAIEDYNAAIRIKPDDPKVLTFRGAAYILKGNYDKAIEDFNAALRIKPDILEALNGRGLAYAIKGNDDRAIEDFEKALRIDPYNDSAKKFLELVRQTKAGAKK